MPPGKPRFCKARVARVRTGATSRAGCGEEGRGGGTAAQRLPRGGPAGERFTDDRPERGRMIPPAQMRELVDHNVLEEVGREEHESPVETDGAVGGTAPPARALVAHDDAARAHLERRSP